jgi:hypothetical protein
MKTETLGRLGAAFLVVGLAAGLGGACGSSAEGSAGGSTEGAGGAGGAAASVGSGTFGCDPACAAPQVCSAANVCIDQGTCAVDADCEVGTVCELASKLCVPGGGCGAQEAKAEGIPPNMLVVLDRSCSMTQDGGGGKTKWQVSVESLSKLTADFNGKIRFGLTMFPDLVTPDCQQDAIPIPVGPGKEMEVQTLLNAALAKADKYFPDGPCVTNIDTAITQAATEPAFNDQDRDSYVVLVSDGKQSNSCGGNAKDLETEQHIADLLAMKGVPTFVIGFNVGVDGVQLDKFAVAGGVPSTTGPTKFYDAADQASLDAALKTIAIKTLSCSFTLDKTPENLNEIYVFIENQTKVPQDKTHMSGWDYDPATNQVTFFGPVCDDLKNGVIKDLDIVLGCDAPTPN